MVADRKTKQPRRRQGGLHAFRSLILFGLVPLALVTSPVSAQLVEVDLNGVPQVGGPAALDTYWGLIWLELSTLETSDYDTAEGYMGFRHATEFEVTDLFLWSFSPAGCNVTIPLITDAILLLPACILFPDEMKGVTYAVYDDGDPADGVGVGSLAQDVGEFCEAECSTSVLVMPNGVLPTGQGFATRTDPAPHWMVKSLWTPQCSNGTDDDADGLIDTADPDCANASDNSEYHLSEGDILAVSYELPPALYRVDPATGTRTYLMGPSLEVPWGVAIGPAGEIYVSDAGLDAILELDPLDGNVRVVSSGGGLDFPRGLVVEADGNLLVADGGAQAVFRIDPVTGVATDITTSCAGDPILEPRVLELGTDPSTIAYVTDGATGQVYEIVTSTIDTVCGQVSGGTSIANSWGIAVEDDGQLLVIDTTTDEIVRLDPEFSTETPLHTVSWNFNVPRGMTFEADGKLLVADYLNKAIYRLDVDTGTQVALSTGPRFTDVAVVTVSVPPSTSVPVLPSWGLALLTCGLGAAALRRLRGKEPSVGSGS